MSAPRPSLNNPLGITIHWRQSTYKTFEGARRAFYKWVCKQELYGQLFFYQRGNWTLHGRKPAKYTYGTNYVNGYPDFDASRSFARNVWEKMIQPHIDRALVLRLDAQRIAERNRSDAMRRIDIVEDPDTRHFFRVMSAGSTLPK